MFLSYSVPVRPLTHIHTHLFTLMPYNEFYLFLLKPFVHSSAFHSTSLPLLSIIYIPKVYVYA